MTPQQYIDGSALGAYKAKLVEFLLEDISKLTQQAEIAALNGDAGRAARLLIQTATLRRVIKYGEREQE